MSEYQLAYGYLKLVKLPKNIATTIPTFKEEKIKLSKEEVHFLLEQLDSFRAEKIKQNSFF